MSSINSLDLSDNVCFLVECEVSVDGWRPPHPKLEKRNNKLESKGLLSKRMRKSALRVQVSPHYIRTNREFKLVKVVTNDLELC
jgi:hypothetical protein